MVIKENDTVVKNILKQSGVTLSQFASDLNISRPTLDNYIDIYDSGHHISNTFYHDIFDFLFENSNISDDDFIKRYRYMKNYYGFSSGEAQITVSKLKSSYTTPKGEYMEVIDEIIGHLNSDKMNPDTPLETYKMILKTLKMNSDELFNLYKFYSIFSGNEKLGLVNDDEKKIYSELYNAMRNIKNTNMPIRESLFEEFTNYANEAYDSKHYHVDQIKKTLNDKLNEVLLDEIQKGDLNKMSIDQIIEVIKRKL